MEAWLNSVLSRIADGTLLPATYYRGLDCDAVLDARSRVTPFDTQWVRQSEEIEERWAMATVSAKVIALAEDIRRESFLAVSETTRQHEIASYVSDDLDVIVRGRLVGMESRFLDQLWSVYERGEFPYPPLL